MAKLCPSSSSMVVDILRVVRPGTATPPEATAGKRFRLPLGPVIPILALVLCAVLLIAAGQKDHRPFLYGGYMALSAIPAYMAMRFYRRRRGEDVDRSAAGGD